MNEAEFYYCLLQETWAEIATCFVVESTAADCEPLIFGPFVSVQDAMVFDVHLNDEHAIIFPDRPPLTTTVRCVLPADIRT